MIIKQLSPKEKFWREFFGQASSLVADSGIAESESYATGLFKQVLAEFDSVAKLNDPRGIYALCVACELE